MSKFNEGISVIITVFNNSQYLKRSLSSVLTQTKLPQEIVIVNDGSNKYHELSIKNIINSLETETEIKYFFKKNGGPSSSRNFGLTKSNYKFICFLDVDDEMEKKNIELKYNLLIKLDHKIFFGVYGNAKYFKSKNLIFSNDSNYNVDTIGRVNGICGSSPCYMFVKSNLIKINGFDEDLSNNEDFDLIIRLLKFKYRSKFLNEIGLIIHKTNNSLSRNYNFKKTYINTLKFLEKAKKNNYFTYTELNKRLKELHITYAKNMIINFKFKDNPFFILKKSFSFSNPVNIKEYLLYYFTFFIKK
ncbi:glycosyltransferase family 2 protein [Alphaproteobacteria bacterium]|nr:glycosyltransferase family 2 protein [Alphaproteobacteria bacterium]